MRILAAIGVIAVVVAVAAGVYLFGGFYNVAASEEDAGVVSWALVGVREASLERHSGSLSPPVKLDDPAMIRAGAAAPIATARPASNGPSSPKA
jgi:hypothetical protein